MTPFGLYLSTPQEGNLLIYLDLLYRWNRKINLTAPGTPEEWVTRHFAESLYLSRWLDLSGPLLDIGSGAGFPGLALKLVRPELPVTLLEPVAKKRAFLKEVARTCRMEPIEVLGDRLEVYSAKSERPSFAYATARAVGGLERLIRQASRCLRPNGTICLWLGSGQSKEVQAVEELFEWQEPIPIPVSRTREIWIGKLVKVEPS